MFSFGCSLSVNSIHMFFFYLLHESFLALMGKIKFESSSGDGGFHSLEWGERGSSVLGAGINSGKMVFHFAIFLQAVSGRRLLRLLACFNSRVAYFDLPFGLVFKAFESKVVCEFPVPCCFFFGAMVHKQI